MAVPLQAHRVADAEGVAFGAGQEALFAREDIAHRAPRPDGGQGQHALVDHVLLAAEATAHRAHHHAHLVDGPPQDLGQHVAVVGDVLAGRVHGHAAIGLQVGQAGFGLQVGVFNGRGLVGLLDHQVGLLQPGLHVALADPGVLADIARRMGMQLHGAGCHGGLRIEQRGQHLVVHADAAQRSTGDLHGLGGHGQHRFPNVAHHATGHHRLVLDEDAEVVHAGHVVAAQHAFDAGHGTRRAGVDAQDARMRVRAAQHLQVQHVGHPQVGGVLHRAGHLARRVDARRVVTDEAGGLALLQRAGGQAAVEHVARQLHRVQDLLVAGAAADVAAQPFLDLVQVGLRASPQRGGGGHHHARDAVAALAGAALVKRALQHRHAGVAVQVVHGLHRGALDLLHRHQATLDQLAVDEHRAGAAFTGTAAFLVAGQLELFAHEVDQPVVVGHTARHRTAVDRGADLHQGVPAVGRRLRRFQRFRHGWPPWAGAARPARPGPARPRAHVRQS